MARSKPSVALGATIDLNRVATWVQVVDSGSITAAARTLGRPKSSVSRAVKHLEEELGLTLLSRTTRRLKLTRAGERYLQGAREALRVLDEAHAELVSADGVPRGTVRITAPFDPSRRLGHALAEALSTFTDRYPQVFVDLMFTGRRADLLAEGIDLAVRAGTLEDETLVARKLSGGVLVLAAAPSYVAAHGVPRKLSDLARHQVILFNSPLGSMQLKLTGNSGSESVTVRGSINVDEISSLLLFAERGAGIAFLPDSVVEDSLGEGRLVRVLPQYSRRDASLYLVYPALRQVPRRVALLREHLYAGLKAALAGRTC